MTRCMAFVNFKGGVGKTSLVVNLAAVLAHELNRRVLVVDCDAQCNASIWLAGPAAFVEAHEKHPTRSLFGLLTRQTTLSQDIIWRSPIRHKDNSIVKNLDLIPASPDLMDIEDDFQPEGGMNGLYGYFYELIRNLWQDYDYILFDCPPNFYRATRCAIFASREIYVPCHPDALSNMGIAPLRRKLSTFYRASIGARRPLGRKFKFARLRGTIINRIPPNANVEEAIEKIALKIRSFRGDDLIVDPEADVLPVRIRQTIEASRVVETSIPAVLASSTSQLTDDYRKLAFYIDGTGDDYQCD